jgi:hypothetical protein
VYSGEVVLWLCHPHNTLPLHYPSVQHRICQILLLAYWLRRDPSMSSSIHGTITTSWCILRRRLIYVASLSVVVVRDFAYRAFPTVKSPLNTCFVGALIHCHAGLRCRRIKLCRMKTSKLRPSLPRWHTPAGNIIVLTPLRRRRQHLLNLMNCKGTKTTRSMKESTSLAAGQYMRL